eukprot:TRINITY_DN106539_c1_g1_i3.p1 TRINITY_DN106539_c1_g1~~TRINITY_DN106539_c1_g1_i3.p1  ORF type:complete len:209 (-),score=15.95 TRINITY_DN106539_c1_g1_i3:131-757(-)
MKCIAVYLVVLSVVGTSIGQTVPPTGRVLDPPNFFQASSANNAAQQGFSPLFSTVSNDLIAQIQAYDQQYCEDYSYAPSEYVPARFFGPSSNMTINLGECHLIKDKSLVSSDISLECMKPEITFESFPMNYTSHHQSPEEFCTKECEISVPFGHIPAYSEKVLHVFDGSMPLDVQALVQVMTNTISEVLGTTKFDIADLDKFKLFQKP